MFYLVILLVFVCSVLSAPVGQLLNRPSGTGLSSLFTVEPVKLAPSRPLMSASTPAANLLPVKLASVATLLRSWAAPPDMTDLSSFNVSGTPVGNIQVVAGKPTQAFAAPSSSLSFSTWNNESSVIQVFYPQGSINPANTIVGGGDFYATPLDMSQAHNVSLEYSVFFPLDFDWVQGGKLPGLYGGHKSCSGGDSAISCFSTRLMWREKGAGELYLYAPKDKQTKELCSTPPKSICEASYGLSIARGSFSFTPGAWTHVKQTVTLNNPSQQDGTFRLEANGKPVIDRKDVYYRGAAVEVPHTGPANIPQLPPTAPIKLKRSARFLMMRSSQINLNQTALVNPTTSPSETSEPIGFTGLFFSTFFGGHESSWATPKDQYAWFKDFAININS